ncbi:hypothetical protein [Hoeflea olei]|uniref:SGNH hydrolase-type esterase domain-containing protein n=1 Tax=Hoeflea olei TaxID=1480615 RepID=A0A1C1YQD9_9HYPH|nr:hypothetical protein [Hoeflea olei]OCW55616.1 hypothetical protein AWJ14_06415 [Hoeflea olei]
MVRPVTRAGLTALLFGFALPALAADITWSVDQPFRFLRFASDHLVHELAFADASKTPGFRKHRVSAMEARLNSQAWWTTPPVNGGATPKAAVEALRAAEGRLPDRFDIRLGWASLLRNHDQAQMSDATCWNVNRQDFMNCRSDVGGITARNGYIVPEHHFVTVRISDGVAGQACRLRIETALTPGYGFVEDNRKSGSRESAEAGIDCAGAAVLRIPYGTQFTVSGTAQGLPLAPVEIRVRDFMIASLGDSFASGEGNPDLPAVLDAERTIRPRYDEASGDKRTDYGVPRRKARPDGTIAPFSSARWLDRRCHRSMYSAHTRAAIALALSGDRHHAVTYASYACSGAEITDGLFWPQDGRECIAGSAGNFRHMEPQIGALVGAMGGTSGGALRFLGFDNTLEPGDAYTREVLSRLGGGTVAIRKARGLCQAWPGGNRLDRRPLLQVARFGRKIDLLLLGIGGNDMGFSKLVTSLVMTSGLTDPFGDLMAPIYAMAAGGISLAEARRNIDLLDGRYEMLARAVRDKLEIADPAHVLLTGYPSPAFDENRRYCDSRRRGMNATRFFSLAGPEQTAGKANIREAQGVVERLNGKIRSLAKSHGFTFIDSHFDRFRSHGICATAPGRRAAEQLDLPHKRTGAAQWQVFNPATSFHPYAPRQRWFRTFNDSYLLMYHYKANAYEEDPVDVGNPKFLALRTLGGPVHPTAEGHAAMADSLYCAAAEKLLAGQKDALCD